MSTSSVVAETYVTTIVPTAAHRNRAFWQAEAVRTHTDWSSLLRQRIRVLHWISAGRPPLAQWHTTERAR